VPITEDQVKEKNILIVEDILDSGSTIVRVKETLEKFNPKCIKYAIIFHKRNPKNQKYDFFGDYTGFIVPNDFLVGYGIDYNDHFRDLRHLCVVSEEGVEALKDPR
jgi:hypoxanthine phosphoribosyltransferase